MKRLLPTLLLALSLLPCIAVAMPSLTVTTTPDVNSIKFMITPYPGAKDYRPNR